MSAAQEKTGKDNDDDGTGYRSPEEVKVKASDLFVNRALGAFDEKASQVQLDMTSQFHSDLSSGVPAFEFGRDAPRRAAGQTFALAACMVWRLCEYGGDTGTPFAVVTPNRREMTLVLDIVKAMVSHVYGVELTYDAYSKCLSGVVLGVNRQISALVGAPGWENRCRVVNGPVLCFVF